MIVVSACLVGKNCRYNAQTKLNEDVVDFLKDKEYLLFCPEEPLGTPREPIHVENSRLYENVSKKDVTDAVVDHIEKFLKDKSFELAILKSRSPSCAIKSFGEGREDGLFTQILRKRYKELTFLDEEQISSKSCESL